MSEFPARQINVLVVEDNEVDYRCLAMLLRRTTKADAYKLTWAPTFNEGLQAILGMEYDVGVLDYRLDVGTGLDLLREARKRGCGTPVIMLTGFDSAEIDREASREGASDYLNKVGLTGIELERAIRYAVCQAATLVELRRTTRLLEGILGSLPAVAGRLESNGRVIEVQGTGLSHCGISPQTLMGKVLSEVFPQGCINLASVLKGERANFSIVIRDEKRDRHVEFFISSDTELNSGATFFGREITEHRELEQTLLSAIEDEQQRIGADLHDGLGQQLTGLACMAVALRARLKNADPGVAAQADMIARIANGATELSRALAHGLTPIQLEQDGLGTALEELASQSRRIHGIDCRFRVRGDPDQVEHVTATHVYRIAQEAIHNAVRHGQAARIRISLSASAARKRLLIADDGRGFNERDLMGRSGRGMKLMRFRANIIGGTLSIRSHPGRGTRIECRFGDLSPN